MQQTFEAIYENGVLRPLEGVKLPDGQHVMVSVTQVTATEEEIAAYFSAEDWAAAKDDAISLPQVRTALSGIQGSLADTAIASREER
jgi:predicted DNA-binding antitoxin AbrB/MazE fold protein